MTECRFVINIKGENLIQKYTKIESSTDVVERGHYKHLSETEESK